MVVKVELGDLIQATELGKNMGGFLGEVAAGRRMVVLYNGVPMGALVGLEDFEKLGEGAAVAFGSHGMPVSTTAEPAGGTLASFWQLAESLPAKHTVVGVKPNGGCVALPVAAHYLFVGEDEEDLIALQRAAILGATMSASPGEAQFVLATTRSVHSFTEFFADLHVPHIVCDARDLEFADVAERLCLQVRGEVSRRARLLRENRVGSIARYREKFPDQATDVPDLVIAVDYDQELRQACGELTQLLRDVGRRLDYYGIYVWQFATELSEPPPKWVTTRIAGRVATAADARSLLFTTDAARNLAGGEAYIGQARSAAERFTIVSPDGAAPTGIYQSREISDASVPWPVFPDSVDLEDVIDRWRRNTLVSAEFHDATVPIGLRDRPERREVEVWSVNLCAPVWIWAPSSAARTRVLQLVVQAASRVYPAMQVWAVGVEVQPNAQVVRVAQQASGLVDELYARIRASQGHSGLPEDKWVLLVIDTDNAVDVDATRLDFVVKEGPSCGVCVVQTKHKQYPMSTPENWIEVSAAGRAERRFELLASAPSSEGELVKWSDLVAGQSSGKGAPS
ncbi:hypothetical protein BKG82_27570 [Mycobacteroides chelonae]|uniref:Uncharacterized protein n=1 Tax=Mycobacteroides chelonae TaxID=1774 RepID=A0A1S1LJ76_MYCCH|nr:hypothetical protein BKG82_27570 [Mycobacteroides chelonae]